MQRLVWAMLVLVALLARMSQAEEGRLQVMATHSILGHWVQQVVGDQAEVTVLVGPDGDGHTYEPTPRDAVAMSRAQVVFSNGLGFEGWFDRLYAASGSRAVHVQVADGLTPRFLGEGAHRELDPHVWQDVKLSLQMVQRIGQAMADADPDRADFYAARTEAYVSELRDLEAWMEDRLAALPPARRILFTSHDALGYFADRYGFSVYQSALGAISTEMVEPSAAHVAQVVDEIKASGVPCIFAENIHNPALMENIARDAGVRIAPTLYTDALGAAGTPGATYVGMMKWNVDTLVAGLQPQGGSLPTR
jgi:zinc/manganese transport system substrate-binding protein